MTAELDRLAQAYGISLSYTDEMGTERFPSDDCKRQLLGVLGVDAQTDEDVRRSLAAIEAPACHVPEWLEHDRAWGITCQLYGLRSARNWGIGDFEDLARLAALAGPSGADFIGINPLHALFFAEPRHFSPYAPSSRRFLNPLYIAVDRLEGADMPGSSALESVSAGDLVDYPEVSRLKQAALETAFARARGSGLNGDSAESAGFEAFRREHGAPLEDFALFEALSEAMVAQGYPCGWHGWPEAFRDKKSAAVRHFREENGERILFHMWLQWIAHRQLADAQARARAAGMRIGLYLDLAVGVAPDGASTWSEPENVLRGVRIGCPPDAFNAQGQDWGLAPLSPQALEADQGRLFGQVIREAIGPAGALRIDHAMALMRLYLIPSDLPSMDGAYVHYPLDKMLQALARTSQEAWTVVIGEDLGTVPPNFREVMRAARILGYRVLFFEREEDGRFKPPHAYERDALACISTHDLPTLRGWWAAHDIDMREGLGMIDGETATADRAEREADCVRLLVALADSGVLPEELAPATRGEAEPPQTLTQALSIAVSRFLARTPCRLVALQLEDLTGAIDRANLPGTTEDHPNWQRKLPLTLEELASAPDFRTITQAVAAERPRTP
ncbi:4-alpha-glucanotransferase [Dichotomicrobium thermohalophilum]|uniref:4-alpha-glucanotransferase n=1 Tax=Dichotomicrobium thermohalophilum TaxID=933063 RepID=A0A397Q658_9HYPH|nr:4-alpha-glucanotransferase [Dichotomicrobium thermohalophilum]RIA55949.1 4-alpha-glucanotransferase [Dichotomicrobium thermohalophilum]